MEKLAKGRWWILIIGILAIVGGCVYLNNPIEASLVLVQVLGVIYIVAGILHIVNYFTAGSFVSGFQIVSGILDILVGVLCLVYTTSSAVALVWVIVFWVFFSGIIAIGNSFDLKGIGYSGWWLELLAGILGVILGFMLLSGGIGLQATYVALLISIYLFVIGIDLIALFFSINSAVKHS